MIVAKAKRIQKPKINEPQLTAKRQAFVEEYLKDFNGTQAAIRAGYAPSSAQEQASELLSIPIVADAVARARAERSARAGIDADTVLAEIKALAMANLADFATWGPGRFELHESEGRDTRAVQSVGIKEITITNDHGEIVKVEQTIKLHDKLAALEKLCKHLGLMPDRKEISGPGGGDIQVEVKARDYREALGAFLPPNEEASEP